MAEEDAELVALLDNELDEDAKGRLLARLAKDEALREAQLALLRGSGTGGQAGKLDFSHPYYWAAFELVGDDR